jgi:ectoine hydroxylase-related dioxygenase (phytanoyl-CoA dioxygenase family)
MIAVVSQLLGQPAVLFKEKINFKQPGGSGFTAHQDVQAGWRRYAGYHVTALVSIDPATLANGCLEIAAGWHDKGMLGKEWAPLAAAALEAMDFVPRPTQPGDALFFDCFAPHRSGPNLTDSQRRVLYLTYNRASEGNHRARYFADKRAAYPPDFERVPGKTHAQKA